MRKGGELGVDRVMRGWGSGALGATGWVWALFISSLTGKKKKSSRALQIHSVPLSTVSIQQPTAIQHFSLLKKILQQTRKSNNTDQCIKDVKNTDLTAFQLDCTGFTVRLLLCLFCASEQKTHNLRTGIHISLCL